MRSLNKIIIALSLGLLFFGVYYSQIQTNKQSNISDNDNSTEINKPTDANQQEVNSDDVPLVTTIATGLDTPWAIAFLPDGKMLVTERRGTVQLIDLQGNKLQVAQIEAVKELSEGGLQGIAIHPSYKSNNYVYVYYTYSGDGKNTLNRVSRFNFDGAALVDEEIILNNIPGAPNHDGGRIKFGPDNMLYVATGDAQDPSFAQDINSLAGKILRMDGDGEPAVGNPFNNYTYSYGHRNPQGITWDSNGQLWSTEHGPSGVQTGNDEFNRINLGKNYGWPEIKGSQSATGMETPVIESGFLNTWAPAGVGYLNGKFYFAGLRGSALYELDNNGQNLKTHFKGEFGRIREVVVGSDNMLYITTSNNDGRGTPKNGDDKIIKINPSKLSD